MNFSKAIVITGASSGIGAELARQLGAHGHRLALAARREKELSEVASQSGTQTITVVTDVRHRADIEKTSAPLKPESARHRDRSPAPKEPRPVAWGASPRNSGS